MSYLVCVLSFAAGIGIISSFLVNKNILTNEIMEMTPLQQKLLLLGATLQSTTLILLSCFAGHWGVLDGFLASVAHTLDLGSFTFDPVKPFAIVITALLLATLYQSLIRSTPHDVYVKASSLLSNRLAVLFYIGIVEELLFRLGFLTLTLTLLDHFGLLSPVDLTQRPAAVIALAGINGIFFALARLPLLLVYSRRLAHLDPLLIFTITSSIIGMLLSVITIYAGIEASLACHTLSLIITNSKRTKCLVGRS